MAATGINIAKLVTYTPVEDGGWWRVGSGDSRAGQIGQQIGVIALRHAGGYEIVMHMQTGRVDTFAPMQLYPAAQRSAAQKGQTNG